MRSVVYHQLNAVYHQREALYRKQGSESQTKEFAVSYSPSRLTGRGRGMGTDLQIQNYEDIGKTSIWVQNYLYVPAGRRRLYRKTRARRPRGGDRAQILACGKLQLLLLGSRLHFPSENRKSCTSLHSGSIDSAQNREAELHDFEAQKRDLKVSH